MSDDLLFALDCDYELAEETTMTTASSSWTDICAASDILPGMGVCALVSDQHVAVFKLDEQRYYAIDNVDPKSGASVLSRGLIGSLGDRVVVASPLYKNHFDLTTGECLEAPEHSVKAWQVKVAADRVLVGPPAA